MMAARIKKGDTVVVLAGKDKGRQAQVWEGLTKLNKAIVEGVNAVNTQKNKDKRREAEGCQTKTPAKESTVP